MSSPALFTDIDNTLYDWGAFFAPSFRAMIHAISPEIGVPEEQLYDECKAIFTRHQSLEYPFLIQNLASVKSADLDLERLQSLIRKGVGAFNTVQKKHLQPYPGVVETLKWLKLQGVSVIAVTNSPVYRAQQRLYDLKLDRLISGLIGWEGWHASSDDPVNKGYVSGGRLRRETRLEKDGIVMVPLEECKPNERHYSYGLEAFQVEPRDAWVIGDSLAKDLRPAARLGIRTVWARYGSDYNPDDKNMATLLRITHWNPSRITTTYSKNGFDPDFIVDSFSELRTLFPERCPTLF